MSKFVNEILESIKNTPKDWTVVKTNGYFTGIENGSIVITEHGNSAILSIINVEINGVRIPTTYIDLFRLEKAITKWCKTQPTEQLTK